ncbi:MAG: DUF1080 domain-containing protein [Kiritimatiellae bacterium]|nr:DUF1080 domain-containing protein [Kiritimatiellia bacterium]MDD5521591.1 DUF1080 domain-containing protein [Kiritimatiellia bacterium]
MKRVFISVSTVIALLSGLALAEEVKVIEPFSGKDLTGWKIRGAEAKNGWKVGKASLDPAVPKHLALTEGGNEMVNMVKGHGQGVDIYTEQKFSDVHIEIEVMVAKGSNSGIYLMGEYEIQILDSFGKNNLGMGDMGAIYSAAVPKINACKEAGTWQKYVIDFIAPKFDANGVKTTNAKFVKIMLNDKMIQENVEVKGPTGGQLSPKEASEGPLMFQGNHGPVAYRNIKITPLVSR